MLAAVSLGWMGTLTILWMLGFLTYYYWTHLGSHAKPAEIHMPFWRWFSGGWAGAVVGWILINTGWLPGIAPLHPDAFEALTTANMPRGAFLSALLPSIRSITAVWAAFSFTWLTVLAMLLVRSRKDWAMQAGIWALILSPLAALTMWIGEWDGIPYAMLVITAPAVHISLDQLDSQIQPKPEYHRAIARLKRGHYGAAEEEIIGQLEKFEDDIEGWFMLADMYANQFNELAEADRTIRELCNQPNIPPARVTLALHKLADWHLTLGDNPIAAKSALNEIITRYPGSHFARMASQRIEQLPASAEELRESRAPKPLKLPSLSAENDAHSAEQNSHSPADARKRAQQLVERLTRDPNLAEPREELARLFAGPLRQPQQAIDQLSLLVELVEASPNRKAEWLATIAKLQLQNSNGIPEGRRTLARIQTEFPGTPQARAAKRRIELLDQQLSTPSNQPMPTAKTPILKVELPPGVSMSKTST